METPDGNVHLFTDGYCYVAAVGVEQAQRILNATMLEDLEPGDWQQVPDEEMVTIPISQSAADWARKGVRVL